MDLNSILVVAMLLTFIGLMLVGTPVVYSLFGSAVIFTLVGYLADTYLGTWTGLGFNFLGMVVSRIYGLMSSWVLVACPMFIFMGLMLDKSGTAQKLLYSAQKLFGGVRGGLTVTAMLIGVLMAAATGITGASVVMLGMLSLPPMLKQGYSKELSTGTVCAAGTLGILIPPSIMLVIFGDQLGLSVVDLFMGAMIPGFLLAALYFIYIIVFAYLKPDAAPLPEGREPVNAKLVLTVLWHVLPTFTIILLVLGSIFAGVATVTEASGVGALATVILCLVNRRLSWQVLKDSAMDTFKTIGFIAGILIGATFFAIVLRGLGGDEVIESSLTGLPFGPKGVIIVVVGAIFMLGFFLDWIEISLIILPLLGPMVSKMPLGIEGYGVLDNPGLVWFAVLVAVTLQTSFLTPPVGPAIFYLQGIVPRDVTLIHIYWGVVPFVIIQIVAILLIFLWPELVTWLPGFVYG